MNEIDYNHFFMRNEIVPDADYAATVSRWRQEREAGVKVAIQPLTVNIDHICCSPAGRKTGVYAGGEIDFFVLRQIGKLCLIKCI